MDAITGVVLAGGLGRRMGGVDKGLQVLRGKPMVQWVIERFAPQVDELLVNANQNLDSYGAFGFRVIPLVFVQSDGDGCVRFRECRIYI